MVRPNEGNPGAGTGAPTSVSEAAGRDVRAAAGQAAERARRETGQIMDEARERAKSAISDQKGMLAERIGSVANALRMTAHQLTEQNKDSMARYTDWAAQSLDRVSSSLRDRDFDSLVGQATDFARRRPVAFLGGAVAAGFLISRFLKSSAEYGEESAEEEGGKGEGYRAEAGESVTERPVTAGTIIIEEGPVGTGTGAPRAGGSDAD